MPVMNHSIKHFFSPIKRPSEPVKSHVKPESVVKRISLIYWLSSRSSNGSITKFSRHWSFHLQRVAWGHPKRTFAHLSKEWITTLWIPSSNLYVFWVYSKPLVLHSLSEREDSPEPCLFSMTEPILRICEKIQSVQPTESMKTQLIV